MTGPLALVGSGEYLPVMLEVERSLLAGRAPVYVQLPTAAAPEGEASLQRWLTLGREQAARLGVEQRPVLVRDRDDAMSTELAALVEGAGLVYLSGGNPPYLASVLHGTLVWQAIRAAWEGGAALAGCSAGAIALTSWVPDIRRPENPPQPGLGAVEGVRVIPHFDQFERWMPDLPSRFLEGDDVVLGIDEETALVGDGGTWTVRGRQAVWVLSPEGRTPYRDGEVVPLSA